MRAFEVEILLFGIERSLSIQVNPFSGNKEAKRSILCIRQLFLSFRCSLYKCGTAYAVAESLSHSLAERNTRGVGASRGAPFEGAFTIQDECLDMIFLGKM